MPRESLRPRHEFDVPVRPGRCGSIVSDAAAPGLQRLDPDAAVFYGGNSFLCESVDGSAAERIVLCWEFCRGMTSHQLKASLGRNLLTAGGNDAA